MNKLDEILRSAGIPDDTKAMINSLGDDAKAALNSYYDETSAFYQNAQPALLAHRFLADPEDNPILFHYTTANAIKSILRSKTFLVGSIKHMNDGLEIKYTVKLCCKILKQLGASSSEIENFTNHFQNKADLFDTYIWCFNPNGDSMAMERYGDIALGFDNQEVQKEMATELTPLNFAHGFMKIGDAFVFPLKVNYNKKFQTNYLMPIIKVILACIRNINIDPYDMNQILDSSISSLYLLSLCFKRESIREENEIRFAALKLTSNGETQEDVIYDNKPMIKVQLKKTMLRFVVINHDWDGRENKINDLVSQAEFDMATVRKTKIPYKGRW